MSFYLFLLGVPVALGFIYKEKVKNALEIFDVIKQTILISLHQKINRSIEHIEHIKNDKNNVAISYVLDGRLYKFVTKRRKGPSLVLMVYDENDEDVTNLVVPYLGPERNWHGMIFTPDFWGKKELTFELSTGEVKTFTGDIILI